MYLIYQTDNLPGLAVRGDLDPYSDNTIWFMEEAKNDIWTGNKENSSLLNDYDVLQNYPNPATDFTTIEVNIRKTTQLKIDVVNMMGQKVLSKDAGTLKPGLNRVDLSVSGLTPGMYFYSVYAGETKVTKKMLIE
jgi:N-acetylmuramoyl-L-alanine amidase CwlA